MKGDIEAKKLIKDTDSEINLEKYLENTKFDPRLEINKEKKIENFFQQKYLVLSSYLDEGIVEKEEHMRWFDDIEEVEHENDDSFRTDTNQGTFGTGQGGMGNQVFMT